MNKTKNNELIKASQQQVRVSVCEWVWVPVRVCVSADECLSAERAAWHIKFVAADDATTTALSMNNEY